MGFDGVGLVCTYCFAKMFWMVAVAKVVVVIVLDGLVVVRMVG